MAKIHDVVIITNPNHTSFNQKGIIKGTHLRYSGILKNHIRDYWIKFEHTVDSIWANEAEIQIIKDPELTKKSKQEAAIDSIEHLRSDLSRIQEALTKKLPGSKSKEDIIKDLNNIKSKLATPKDLFNV